MSLSPRPLRLTRMVPVFDLARLDERVRHGVRALERGNDALLAAEREERVAAGVVGAGDVCTRADS